jgi:hypothetical protein
MRGCYHAFGLIGAALSRKIGVFQSSSPKLAPISPNASCSKAPPAGTLRRKIVTDLQLDATRFGVSTGLRRGARGDGGKGLIIQPLIKPPYNSPFK